MTIVLRSIAQRKILIPAFAVVLIASVTSFAWWRGSRVEPLSAELITPMLAVDAVAGESLYFNAPARRWLLARRPNLLTIEDRNERSERTRGLMQAVQNPKLFRQLDRRHRFDTLLLTGDPSQFRPLLEHLMEAKDWTLTYLDHTSLIFKRDATRPWQPADLETVKGRFALPREQAIFLAQAATKMLAVRMPGAAKNALDRAQAADPEVPEVWNGLANYRILRGEWRDALPLADRALELDNKFVPALASKTQILFSTKRLPEALKLSAKLIAAHPDDPALLFYHAKIAHEAHAFAEEIETLKKLIALAEREGHPISGYRIYLAQAYAAKGEAQPSIDEFKRVLADRALSPEQRSFAEETLAQIKSRTGL